MTPRTVARQAPLTMGFSRQEHWSGLPCPLPGDLLSLETEPESSALQVDILLLSHPGNPRLKIPPQQSNGGLCAQVRKQPLRFRVSQSSLTTKTSCHSGKFFVLLLFLFLMEKIFPFSKCYQFPSNYIHCQTKKKMLKWLFFVFPLSFLSILPLSFLKN